MFACLLTQALVLPLMMGADIPYRDEWDSVLPALIGKSEMGLTFSLLMTPVNEHRPLLPMVLVLLLSSPRYYPQVFMALAGCLHCASWLVFVRVLRLKQQIILPPARALSLWLLVVLCFFHGGQLINYTMGLQLFWVLGAFGTMIFIYGLLRQSLILSFLGQIIAVLSFPAWPIILGLSGVFFLSGCLRTSTKKYLLIQLLMLTMGGIYTLLLFFQQGGLRPGFDIARFFTFTLYVIASPFSGYHQIVAWIFAPLFVVLWIYRLIKGTNFVPWNIYLLLGSLTIISALLFAYGRHQYDLTYAFSGHYLIFTLPGWCVLFIENLARIKSDWLFSICLSLLMLIVLVIGGKHFWIELRDRRPMLVKARECIVEGKFRGTECQSAMQNLFFNGFDVKFERLEKSRKLGIFP